MTNDRAALIDSLAGVAYATFDTDDLQELAGMLRNIAQLDAPSALDRAMRRDLCELAARLDAA